MSTVIVGAGNRYQRDDGAGLAAANRLSDARGGLRVLAREGDYVSLLDDWHGSELAILIDATSSQSAPGTIRRYDAHTAPLPTVFARSSTHAFGIADAIELARALGSLPARVIVFGIEGRDFTAGEGLSPEVDAAVDEVVTLAIAAACGCP